MHREWLDAITPGAEISSAKATLSAFVSCGQLCKWKMYVR